MSNSASLAAMRQNIVANELYANVIDNLYFTQGGMMGEDTNNIVQIKKDLKKKKGDRVTFGLTRKLTGDGVSGNSELEGNEEEIVCDSEAVLIDQHRFAVRLDGVLDEVENAYDMRKDAREKLEIRLIEFIERQIFLKLGGVTNTTVTDINGNIVAAKCAWSNTPDYVPDADEAYTGNMYRYVNAPGASLASDFTATKMTPNLISRMRIKAENASPKVVPLRVDGEDYYILFISSWQAYDLKANPTFAQALREADVRGPKNRIFTGALGIYDHVIIKEHPYVPFLDVSAAGNSFRGAASGTNVYNDCFRAILCGRQAISFAQCDNPNKWVEETKDYKDKTGFATGLIGGIQKTMFNSKEYGVILSDTYATPLS